MVTKSQIKIQNTAPHKTSQGDTIVAPATIIFVKTYELSPTDNNFFWHPNIKENVCTRPIAISQTEEILDDDWFYDVNTQKIHKPKSAIFNEKNIKKILALPDNFSTKHFIAMIDGEIKHGDATLIECENISVHPGYIEGHGFPKHYDETVIKTGASNFIILHKAGQKTYTQNEVDELLDRQVCITTDYILKKGNYTREEVIKILLESPDGLGIHDYIKEKLPEIKPEPLLFSREEMLKFAINFADHCLKEAGFEKINSLGEMLEYQNNLKNKI